MKVISTFQRSQCLRAASTSCTRHPGAKGPFNDGGPLRVVPGSKLLHALVQVTTRDESGQITAHGVKQLPSGMLAPDGPPTTLGSSGRDWVAFLQGSATRDATYFVNGTPVGARDIFQVPTLGPHIACKSTPNASALSSARPSSRATSSRCPRSGHTVPHMNATGLPHWRGVHIGARHTVQAQNDLALQHALPAHLKTEQLSLRLVQPHLGVGRQPIGVESRVMLLLGSEAAMFRAGEGSPVTPCGRAAQQPHSLS